MVSYEVCSAYVKFSSSQDLAQFKDYRLGMVHNSSAPAGVEAEYDSVKEAEKDFAGRRSSVVCKGGSLIITEYFLQKVEFDSVDEDGYAEEPIRTTFMGVAPIGDTELAEKLLDEWRGNEEPEYM
jgi:hypothetical protein